MPGTDNQILKSSRHIGSTFLLATCLWCGLTSMPTVFNQVRAQSPELAQVATWKYDPETIRLEVNTRGGVRPSLFILQDPPRVVLDFPNTQLGSEPKHVPQIGQVQSLRLSQLDPTTTRFVLTLDRSFNLNLDQLQLQTAGPERWAVVFIDPSTLVYKPKPLTQLGSSTSQPTTPPVTNPTPLVTNPTPTAVPTPLPIQAKPAGGSLPPPPPISSPLAPIAPSTTTLSPITPPPSNPIPPSSLALNSLPNAAGSTTQLLGIAPTQDGFLVKTNGPASANIRRIVNPDRIVVDILNTTISKGLTQRAFTVNRLGVYQLRVGQFEPTVARVVLDVDPTSSDWETQYDPQQGGIILAPAGGGNQASLLPDTPSDFQGSVATITNVSLVGNQLTIAADGFLFYRSGWEPESGGYRISVKPARLPQSLPDPGLPPNGPIDRIRFRQETSDTVSILVQPSQDLNIVEPTPGQGGRQITLLVQAPNSVASGQPSLPTSPVNPVPGVPPVTVPAPIPGQRLVAIDPGHGGRDPGATANGILEKNITLSVSFKVAQLLQSEGIGVVMTRTDDREVLLQPRVDTAVQAGAAILVSIHANAIDRSGISGIETYYLRPDSERLAGTMHRAIVSGTGGLDRGVRRARFFMVRETPTTMPSVLLELGYVTNPTEASKLASDEYQTALARSIVNGIKAYFQGSP